MYKADFRSKTFLRTPKDVLDHIDYMDDADELRKYYAEIAGYDTQTLLEELDRIEEISPYKDINDKQKELVQELLSTKLGYGFEFHYMLDMISEQLQHIERSFKELDGLKNHRHKVGEGHYSEKPAW